MTVALHAAVIGIGWFVVGLPLGVLAAVHDDRTAAIIRALPDWWLVLAVATLPSVALSFRASSSPLLRWVWLGPVAVAAAHCAVARSIPKTAT
jgi:hypothetical protein